MKRWIRAQSGPKLCCRATVCCPVSATVSSKIGGIRSSAHRVMGQPITTQSPRTDIWSNQFHRSLFRKTRSHWEEHTVANIIFTVPPTNALTKKTGHPNKECECIPYRDQGDDFPQAGLLQAPDADNPSHS